MEQRIRNCFKRDTEQLDNIVKIDETFIGGRRQNAQCGKGNSYGMVERGGNLICKVVPNKTATTLRPIILANVKTSAIAMTDELKSYKSLDAIYIHYSVNHGAKQWVDGQAHTNTI